MSNSQKVIIVTGASQGIGAGVVEGFRALGHKVVATSRSIQPSTDPDILTVAGDIADPATAERVVREAVARFGRIDTLVNNAGIFVAKPFTSYTKEDYAQVVATNMSGFFYISQLAIAEMEKNGSGHVVSVTTSLVDHAIDGVPSVMASLTKGGINAATKSIAIEYAKRGIRANAVSPGIIKTPMHGAETHDALASCIPSVTWARSMTSFKRFSTWTALRLSPARSCTSTAVRAQAIEAALKEFSVFSEYLTPEGILAVEIVVEGAFRYGNPFEYLFNTGSVESLLGQQLSSVLRSVQPSTAIRHQAFYQPCTDKPYEAAF